MQLNLSYNTIADAPVKEVPEFGYVLTAHKVDNDGEVLPHVLFGDLTRFAIAAFRGMRDREHPEGAARVFRAVVRFVECAWICLDYQVQELVHVSFLENLHLADDDYSEMVAMLGPESQRIVKRIERDR